MPISSGAAIAVLCLCLGGWLHAEGPPRPKDIPVVRTWGDLLDVPPIEVAGRPARVGIEADSFEAGGGVLFYCLAEGPHGEGGASDAETVGPVSVFVVRQGCPKLKTRVQWQAGRVDHAKGPRLYVGVVAAGADTVCTEIDVQVRPVGASDRGEDDGEGGGEDKHKDKDKDKVPALAGRAVRITPGPYHGWTRLLPSRPADPPVAGGDADRGRAERIVVTRVDGTAWLPAPTDSFRSDSTDPSGSVPRTAAPTRCQNCSPTAPIPACTGGSTAPSAPSSRTCPCGTRCPKKPCSCGGG
jgi:hypothetical protein